MNIRRFISVTVASILILAGCSGNNKQGKTNQADASGDGHTTHSGMKMESGEPTDESIYNVSSSWQDRYGKTVRLENLRGRVQVVAMVYTHCEFACPRILADMKRIRDSLSEEALGETNFVIISIDPERDTPERLNQFAAENDLDDEQWTLLHGDRGDILEIAALLGVKYKRISETDFTHSNIITVLNRKGEIVHQRKKLMDRQTDTIREVENLAAG